MAAFGAGVPTLGTLAYDLIAGIPTPLWRETVAKAIAGGGTAAWAYLKTNPYDTKLGPNMTAATGEQKLVINTAEMDKATQQAAGK